MFKWYGTRRLRLRNILQDGLSSPKNLITLETPPPSGKYQQYEKFFAEVQEEAKEQLRSCQTSLAEHGIVLLPKQQRSTQPDSEVFITNIERGGSVITYQVRLGRLLMNVTLLNVDSEANEVSGVSLYKGSFGEVFCTPNRDTCRIPCLTKRILLSVNCKELAHGDSKWLLYSNFAEIESAVKEFAFGLVCSALKIGPKMRVQPGFDLICFRNAVQWNMEMCQPLFHNLASTDQFCRRMKYCLRVLHVFGLVHRDVKPANIVFSLNLGDFVLIDFGISWAASQLPGQLSSTYREGTLRYMSFELSRLSPQVKGMVDLFWNDAEALAKTTFEVNRIGRRYPRNNSIENTAKSSLDKAIDLVYSIYSNQRLPLENIHQNILRLTKSVFGAYFLEQRERSIPENADFLVKCMGFSESVRLLLGKSCEKMPKDLAVIAFIDDLNGLSQEYPMQPVYQDLEQLTNQLTLLKKTFKDQQGIDQQRTIDKIQQLLLEIADEEIDGRKLINLSDFFDEAHQFQLMKEQPTGLYHWLSRVFSEHQAGFSKLPSGISTDSAIDVLISASHLFYSASHYSKATMLLESATELIEFYLDIQPSIQTDSSSEKLRIICIRQVRQLLTINSFSDERLELLFLYFCTGATGVEDWKGIIELSLQLMERLISRHFRTAIAYYLASSYTCEDENQHRSIEVLKKAFVASAQLPPSSTVAHVLMLLGTMYQQQRQYSTAIPYLEEAARVLEKFTGSNSEYCFLVRIQLAISFSECGLKLRLEEAMARIQLTFQLHRWHWSHREQLTCRYTELLFRTTEDLHRDINKRVLKIVMEELRFDSSSDANTFILSVSCILRVQALNLEDDLVCKFLAGKLRKIIKQRIAHHSSWDGSYITVLGQVHKISLKIEAAFFLFATISLYCLSNETGQHQVFLDKIEQYKGTIERIVRMDSLLAEQIAMCLIHKKQYKLALHFTNEQPRFLWIRGWCYFRKGQYGPAQGFLKKYLSDLGDKSEGIWLKHRAAVEQWLSKISASRNNNMQEQSHLRKAVSYYTEYHLQNPSQISVMTTIGDCLNDLENHRDALLWYYRVLRGWNSRSSSTLRRKSLLVEMGWCWYQLKNYRAGTCLLKSALQQGLPPDLAKRRLLLLCICVFATKQFRELRRTCIKLKASSITEEAKLREHLNGQSQQLCYALFATEPRVGSGLGKLIKFEKVVLETKIRLRHIIAVKKMSRLLITAGPTDQRRNLLSKGKQLLLQE